MPFANHEGARLYWKADGNPSRTPLLLLNAIGTELGSWDRVLPYLLPAFYVLRMDTRGHGASDVTEGDYAMALLAGDAAAVLDAARVKQAVICGVSLGGMIAMSLALRWPDRVRALVAACSSAKMDAAAWRARIEAVASGGVAAIADAALGRFFSPGFATTHPDQAASVRTALLATPALGYAGCGAAIRDMDLRAALPDVHCPTLIIAGGKDVSTPFEAHGALITAGIMGAQSVVLDCGHLAQIEVPSSFAAAMVRFVSASPDGDAAQRLYESGLRTRRLVLGDEWVDHALARRTEFDTEYQAMITRIAWQEVWGRPGLDHRTRRLLVVAITASLARWEEFRLHVRAGLQQGGFSVDELKEVLMQTAIYAGVPAANTGFAEARAILDEIGTRG